MQTSSKLNPTQLHILQLFNRHRSKSDLEDLKNVLLEFYRKKVDEGTEKVWNKKNLSKKDIEEFLNNPKRIPYK